MVKITKAEAEYIRKYIVGRDAVDGRWGDVTRTMRQKSDRHNYFACENPDIMALLAEYRSAQKVVYEYGNT